MTDRPLICGFMKVRNEVIREGNIHRALANLERFCDVIVACDDASNDETGIILQGHPKVVHVELVSPEDQDFRKEMQVKQRMMEQVHAIQPHFIWWHDGDEELSDEGVQAIRGFCEHHLTTGVPAFRFRYAQLWRSDAWVRTDSGFGDGSFIKLWRWKANLSFATPYGTHHAQFPQQLMELLPMIPEVPWPVIHWGNYGKNLEWKCIQYHGGLGGVDRHLKFEHAKYEPLFSYTAKAPAPVPEKPVPYTAEEQAIILSMEGLRQRAGWFTVVVPAYNRVKTLTRALESLLNQSYQQWIAVVLDDGSTDGTPALMRQWQERDPRVFYARYPVNRGGVAVNEIGMNLACEFTEYWSRLGSDDFFDPNKLELDAWALREGVDAVYGPYAAFRSGARMETCNPPVKPTLSQNALFNGIFAASWANIAVRCTALQRVRQRWGRYADPRLRNMEDFLVNARIGRVTSGFHFRGIANTGDPVFIRTDEDAERWGAPQESRHLFKPDACWNIGIDGASSNQAVTARDDAMTRVIIQEDQAAERVQ